jgi:hypothetical protein
MLCKTFIIKQRYPLLYYYDTINLIKDYNFIASLPKTYKSLLFFVQKAGKNKEK